MAAGFGGVQCEYARWLIFMFKVTSEIKFGILLGEGWCFEKRRSDVFRSKIELQVAP